MAVGSLGASLVVDVGSETAAGVLFSSAGVGSGEGTSSTVVDVAVVAVSEMPEVTVSEMLGAITSRKSEVEGSGVGVAAPRVVAGYTKELARLGIAAGRIPAGAMLSDIPRAGSDVLEDAVSRAAGKVPEEAGTTGITVATGGLLASAVLSGFAMSAGTLLGGTLLSGISGRSFDGLCGN